jgi:DNA-binding FadR family transcriptional regulator
MALKPDTSHPDRADDDLITRHKLSDQVFEKLWHMIETGDLAPGDSLPSERDLMDRFGVGRPAVREALQSMANKGLITITHGERSRVNAVTASVALHQIDDLAKMVLMRDPTTLDHLKQLRQMLEAGSVRLAATA